MCGGNKGQTTSTSSNAPPPQVMAEYEQIMSRANQVAGQPYQPYTGNMVAGFSPDQLAAFKTVEGAQGIAQPYFDQAGRLATAGSTPLTAADINQYYDPYQTNVIDATQRQFNLLNAQQQAQLTGKSLGSGGLFNDRFGVAQGELGGEQAAREAPVLAGLETQGFTQAAALAEQQKQAEQQGAYTFGNLGTANLQDILSGASAQLGTGGQQQQYQQQLLNWPYAQYLQAQAFPYQQTGWLAGVDTGVGSNMGGQSTTTTTPPKPWYQFWNRGGGINRPNFQAGGASPPGIFSFANASPYSGGQSYIQPSQITRGAGPPKPPGASTQKAQSPLGDLMGLGKLTGLDKKAGSMFDTTTQGGISDKLGLTGGGLDEATQAGAEAGLSPEELGFTASGEDLLASGAGDAAAGAGAAAAGEGGLDLSALFALFALNRGGGINVPFRHHRADGGASFDERFTGEKPSFQERLKRSGTHLTGNVEDRRDSSPISDAELVFRQLANRYIPPYAKKPSFGLPSGSMPYDAGIMDIGRARGGRSAYQEGGDVEDFPPTQDFGTDIVPPERDMPGTALGGFDTVGPPSPSPSPPAGLAPMAALPTTGTNPAPGVSTPIWGAPSITSSQGVPTWPGEQPAAPALEVPREVGAGRVLPRGLRNNNPGNIEDGSFTQNLPGYAGSDGRFAKFETPEAGRNAQSALLDRYGRQGIDTVKGVISRWAPASDGNDVDAYSRYVAGRLGIKPGDKIDLADPAMRGRVASAMAEFENGVGGASHFTGEDARIPSASPPTSGGRLGIDAATAGEQKPGFFSRLFTPENALRFGLGMLANPTPYLGTAIGQAGLATLGASAEQERYGTKEVQAERRYKLDEKSVNARVEDLQQRRKEAHDWHERLDAQKAEADLDKHETLKRQQAAEERRQAHEDEAARHQRATEGRQQDIELRKSMQPVKIGQDDMGRDVLGVPDTKTGGYRHPITGKPIEMDPSGTVKSEDLPPGETPPSEATPEVTKAEEALPKELLLPESYKPKRDERFLSTLPPRTAAAVKGMVDYDIDPMNFSSRSGRGGMGRADMVGLAKQYDPAYDQSLYAGKKRAVTEFFAGGPTSPAGVLTAGNTAILHAGEMSDAIEKLNANGWLPGWTGGIPFGSYLGRRLYNAAIVGQGGKDSVALSEFDTARQRFTEEVTRFYSGAQGSEGERDRAIGLLDAAKSLPELRAAIAEDAKLMSDRVQQYRNRIAQGMGPAAWKRALVTDPNQVLYYQNSRDAVRTIDERNRQTNPTATEPVANRPPAGAVEHLRSNPALKGAFDQKYGAGAADRALGAP